LEPKLGIREKRPFVLFELKKKSGKNDFLRTIFLLKELPTVQKESFVKALCRLV